MILEHAVKTSNVVAVRDILKTASLEAMDETDFNGRTPLMLACFRGNSEIIKLLIKGGAGTHSRDRWGKTALMYAVQRGHVETVKMLLHIHADAAARDNDGREVAGFARPGTLSYDTLVDMLETSQLEFEERRSRAGSPVGSPNSRSGRAMSPQLPVDDEDKDNYRPTIHQVSRRGILPDIIPPPKIDTSLVHHDAPFCFKDPLELARRGLDNELKAILPQVGGVSKFGLNQPNKVGRTPLMVAILNGKLESCLIIIKAGGLINETDLTGKTVLFYAIAKRSIETINALIDAGADPDAVDKFGRTPLMQACMDGNVLAVRAVLEAGAKVSSYDNKGRTAVMYAVAKGNIATIKEMVDAGADPTAKDHSGKRVDQFALTRSNFDKISPILSRASAEWKVAHPSIYDSVMLPETTYSFLSPPGSPSPSKSKMEGEGGEGEGGVLLRDDSFFGSPSRLNTASSFSSTGGEGGARKRIPPVFASPFNPKANRSTLELVRIADYVALDAFLDGCSLVAVNEQDKKSGRTALMVAVLQQKLLPARMLLDAGADMEIKDCQGKTALAHAAANGNMECIQLLLETGANVLPLDSNGRTPVDQAELGGNEQVYDILVAASSPKKKLKKTRSSFEELIDEKCKYEESKSEEKGVPLEEGTKYDSNFEEEEEEKVESKEEANNNGILTVDCK